MSNVLESLPDGPIPESTLESLEEGEKIKRVMPMMMRFGTMAEGDEEVVDRFVLQTATGGYVLDYEPDDGGWVVEEKVSGEDRSDDEVFEELMFVAQAGQSGAVEAMEEIADEHYEFEL